MSFLKNLAEQFKTVWMQMNRPAQIGLVAAAVACVAAIVGVGLWSSRPQFVPIASELSPTQAADIVSKLDAEGIPNKLNFAGSAVMVPKPRWNKARLLLGDLAGPTPPGVEPFQQSLLSDPSLNHFKMLRHQESQLANTISRISAVQNATVHISRTEPSPFVRDSKPTSASVVIELQRGAVFTREQAAAVVAMMAGSVEGLEPDQITVLDTTGRVLSSHGSARDADIGHQFEYRRRLETDLASKAEMMLGEMLGSGRAIVRVTADVDFTQSQRTETVFDPDSRVRSREHLRTKSRTGPANLPFGPAGTAANVTAAGAANQLSTSFTEREEENETEYENNKIVDTIKEASGVIRRLTIAAMVDLNREDEAAEGGALAAPAKEQVEAIIKQAVGFDPQRNDQIEVLVTRLAGSQPTVPPTGFAGDGWKHWAQLLRNASLGIASFVALVIGLLIVRKMKPVTLHSPADAHLPPGRSQRVADLSTQAIANPEAVAKIIGAWLGETAQQEKNETSNKNDQSHGDHAGQKTAA